MISQGNAVWNTTEKKQFVLNTKLENYEKLNH